MDDQALFSVLYAELHRLARRELNRANSPQVTLAVTELLHNAYVQMSARNGSDFPDRARFMGYASRVMRGLIIDYARNRQAQKRGGQFEFTSLRTEIAENLADPQELSRISDALDELAKVEPALAQVIDLKFFCGFSFGEIAAMQNVSERTVQRQWDKARIFLHQALSSKEALE